MNAGGGASPLPVVAVCHAVEPARMAERLIRLAGARSRTLRGVVVSNNPAHAEGDVPEGWVGLRGSNRTLDFSGYLEGLERLAALGLSDEPSVLFVNDSLITKHAAAFVLDGMLGIEPLVSQVRVAALAGKIDPARAIRMANPWSGLPFHVSTFCFLLNRAGRDHLRHLPEDAARHGLPEGRAMDDAEWGAGLPASLQESIRAHLLYAGSPDRWPGAPQASRELLARKARCVYFEQRLSGVIGREGVLVDAFSGPRAAARSFLAETWARVQRTASRR